MKFLSERIDEVTKEVILEFEATDEEKNALDEFCRKNDTTLDKLVTNFLEESVNHPKEVSKWIKENRDDKLPKGTPGKPFYNKGDVTGFYLSLDNEEIFCIGTIEIIDAYGTYFQLDQEPSYDILVENFNNTGETTLVKHIVESLCYDIKKKS